MEDEKEALKSFRYRILEIVPFSLQHMVVLKFNVGRIRIMVLAWLPCRQDSHLVRFSSELLLPSEVLLQLGLLKTAALEFLQGDVPLVDGFDRFEVEVKTFVLADGHVGESLHQPDKLFEHQYLFAKEG